MLEDTSTTGTCVSWAKEARISLWAAGKGTDGANIHTHTQIHTFSQHKVTAVLKLKKVMAGVSHSGFPTKAAWERTAAGEELWWNRGWATHRLSLHKLTHQCCSPVHWALHAHLQSSYRPHRAACWHQHGPNTHTNNSPAPTDALFKNMYADCSLESTLHQ